MPRVRATVRDSLPTPELAVFVISESQGAPGALRTAAHESFAVTFPDGPNQNLRLAYDSQVKVFGHPGPGHPRSLARVATALRLATTEELPRTAQAPRRLLVLTTQTI
jgi:hypothetical protein